MILFAYLVFDTWNSHFHLVQSVGKTSFWDFFIWLPAFYIFEFYFRFFRFYPLIKFYFHIPNCFYYLIHLSCCVFMFLIQTFIYVLFELLKHIYDCYFEVLSYQSFILLFLGNIMMEMLVTGETCNLCSSWCLRFCDGF